MYALGIMDGQIHTQGRVLRANLYIEDEKIAAISSERLPCREEIDGKGRHVLPGFIDPHVHFALTVGSHTSLDDFVSGSKAGLQGGVTTYIDFLDPVKTVGAVQKSFEDRMRLAQGSLSDYGFHGTIANPTDDPEAMIEAYNRLGIHSVKLFTTYSNTDRRTYDDYIYRLLEASKASKTRIMVHAENDELISKAARIPVADHEASRPVICESVEVMKLGQMAQATEGLLYIVHVSAGSSAALLGRNFPDALRDHQIMLESCPHYFLLNAEQLKGPDGYRFTMTPPIRSEAERLLLIENLNHIYTIGTDHCPFDIKLKRAACTGDIPMGIGGIRYAFLNMYNLFGMDILDRFTSHPAKAFGLYGRKGCLSVGADADVVIFNDKEETRIEDINSVYDGRVLKGRIETVLLRGSVVLDGERFSPSTGRYLET